MKNGMPISEVTMPIGKIVPGRSDLLTTELAERISGFAMFCEKCIEAIVNGSDYFAKFSLKGVKAFFVMLSAS